MEQGLGQVQRRILGVACAVVDLLRDCDAGDWPHAAHELGPWAIDRQPLVGPRYIPDPTSIPSARSALSRAAARLGRRGLLTPPQRLAWSLTPRGETLGPVEAEAFRGLVALRALCAYG